MHADIIQDNGNISK